MVWMLENVSNIVSCDFRVYSQSSELYELILRFSVYLERIKINYLTYGNSCSNKTKFPNENKLNSQDCRKLNASFAYYSFFIAEEGRYPIRLVFGNIGYLAFFNRVPRFFSWNILWKGLGRSLYFSFTRRKTDTRE